jgi:hypothetical protein
MGSSAAQSFAWKSSQAWKSSPSLEVVSDLKPSRRLVTLNEEDSQPRRQEQLVVISMRFWHFGMALAASPPPFTLIIALSKIDQAHIDFGTMRQLDPCVVNLISRPMDHV